MYKASPLSNRETLAAAIEVSSSKKEVIEHLGLRAAGSNYKKLERYAALYELELPRYEQRSRAPIPLEKVFVAKSPYTNRTGLKKKMYSLGIKKECVECQLGPIWNGKPITLQVDHINGVHNDNRLENLAIICPNCHSQTATYAGANRGRQPIPQRGPYYSTALLTTYLEKKSAVGEKTKKRRGVYRTDYPPLDDVIDMIEKAGYSATARSIGVSNNTLRAFVKNELGDEDSMPESKYKRVDNITYPAMNELITSIYERGYTAVAEEIGVSDNAIRKHIRNRGYEPPRFHHKASSKA